MTKKITEINKTQKIIFDLMEISSFNRFDGKKVVQDLKKNIGKWLGAIWGKFGHLEMLPLRDIPENIYNADTLYLSIPKKYIPFFEDLAKNEWKIDEIGYFCNGELKGTIDENLASLKDYTSSLGASPKKDVAYMRLWWD